MSDKIWTFEYEPKSLNEMIVNEEIKPKLEKAIKELPNILLYGTPGIGKGTFVHILLRESGCDHMWVNASDHTGIDFIRDQVKQFAITGRGLSDKQKIVVLNEADSLSSGPQGAQKMLRQLMEDVQNITRFIFLANYEQYIIPELKSRCQTIKMDNPPKKEIGLFCSRILKNEGIQYDPKTLIKIVQKCYPDIRRTIWALQENTIEGKLVDSRIYSSEDVFRGIIKSIKEKDVEAVRAALKSNYIVYPQLYEYLYENAGEFSSPGGAILAIGEALKWDGSIANKEINFMRMVVDMIFTNVVGA
jgi:DNA polymerase III delta prime subunit